MVYHPYFRGKQYELITVRETAPILAAAEFRPIIEPVRETLAGLQKALDAVVITARLVAAVESEPVAPSCRPVFSGRSADDLASPEASH